MHFLHKILVNTGNEIVPAKSGGVEAENKRNELIKSMRWRAESATDGYIDRVFDWRETETAGRWSDEYPVNVIFSRDNVLEFLDELSGCFAQQQLMINGYLENICKVSRYITDLVNQDVAESVYYDLLRLSELLYGEYTCESGFFNAEEYSPRITEQTIDDIKLTPDKWALVMFDYHY